MKSDERPIEDSDLYVLESGEVEGQDGGTYANAPAGGTGNYGYFGPTSGGGYGWGTYSTGSSSTPNWQPSGFSGFPRGVDLPYIGTGYDLEYTDAVKKIVDYGTGAISQHPLTINKKAALQNRQEVLRAIADRLNRISKADNDSLNDQAFFDQMQGVMENLFVTAYNPTDVGEDSPLNGLLESKAGGAGYVLAQDLIKDSTAVSVQVFQATLLAAFNEVLYGKLAVMPTAISLEDHSALLKAALELGQTYAKLAPSRETGTILASDADFGFLDMLWRVQQPGMGGRLPGKGEIEKQLKNGVEALGRSLDEVSDPLNTLKFLNNLLNAAANSVALNEPRLANGGGGFDPRGDIRSAQFIRELVAFGFEVARVNPVITTGDQVGMKEWLEILWEGRGDARLAAGGLAKFFDQPGSSQDRQQRLNFSKQLVKVVKLVDDPEVKLMAQSSAHLSYVLDLGSSYAALKPDASNVESKDASFLTLTAQGNLPDAANDLENRIKVLGGITANLNNLIEIPVTATSDGRVSVEGTGFASGSTSPVLWNGGDSDPSNDRYPIAYRVRRADGTVTSAVAGDTLFTFYSERGTSTDPRILYAGDTLLFPSDEADPFGKERLRDLAQKTYSPLEKVFDALRLAPHTAGSTVKGQVEDFVKLITGNPLVAGVAGVAVGGIVAAQFVQPIGVILDVGLILLGGVQFGYSLASFFHKAANARSQTELLDASREAVYAFENLVGALPFGGLLKLEPSLGLVNTTRLLDAGKRLLRLAEDVQRGRSLTLADAISLPLSLFKGEGTAVGRLLQYGTDSVSEFLKGGFSKFSGGLPTIGGLKDFADRFKRVSEVADRLIQAQNTSVASFLAANSNLVGRILEQGVQAIDALSDILKHPGTVLNDLAGLLKATSINPVEVQKLLGIPNVSVTQLNRLGKQANDGIDLLREELRGGHSIERHGSQLSRIDLEQRALGTHPTLQQSRTSLRFIDDNVQRDAVNQAYKAYESDIKSFFASGNDYMEWTFDYGNPTGFGFTNIGSVRNPISQEIPLGATTKVKISFEADPTDPRGYRLVSAFPVYP
ncbi:hypothetical protein C7B65_12930 [Phormidesmis priestleyi ULC007]|uniref:Bacterial CdiA-CT RNAse A domain-containing protein n=1 Tax=Phormidesmis priestleyi ULC007 TaxID=1920490 RepID=A0A2T1DFD9_9CYAN|nr:hypothetical protein C7B65_12930 [Phormidesmis priestleyi ULC007]PZO50025.1 MAG: hypothetical protein DCF14_12875 [Phormidesmis priestleyi]